jgi:2-keto-3-deoxy-L-rhamnonate aldolase RhmA
VRLFAHDRAEETSLAPFISPKQQISHLTDNQSSRKKKQRFIAALSYTPKGSRGVHGAHALTATSST